MRAGTLHGIKVLLRGLVKVADRGPHRKESTLRYWPAVVAVSWAERLERGVQVSQR
jgi:hypothetical protein